VIIDALASAGADIVAFDPEAVDSTRRVIGDLIEYGEDAYEVLSGADALVVCTEWNEFRRPDLVRMKQAMRHPVVFDGRNLYDPSEMAAAGFEYTSVGRPSLIPQSSLVNGEAPKP